MPPSSREAGRRHNPLVEDVINMGHLRTKSTTRKRKVRSDEDPVGDGYIDAQSSRKILALAQNLADEDEEDQTAAATATAPNAAFAFDSRFATEVEEDDDAAGREDEEEWMPEEEVSPEDVDPEDLATYNKFLPPGNQFVDFAPSLANLTTSDGQKDKVENNERLVEEETTNLADLILQRIAEKEALDSQRESGQRVVHGGGPPEDAVEIPAKVAEVFQKYVSIRSSVLGLLLGC